MTTTRERKIAFIKSFGRKAFENLVLEMIAIEGDDFLSDEQIEAMCSKQVSDARYRQHHDMREREKSRQRRLMAYVDAGPPLIIPEVKFTRMVPHAAE